MRTLLLAVLYLFAQGCSSKSSTKDYAKDSVSSSIPESRAATVNTVAQPDFPYTLMQPTEKYKMPQALTEISAISMYRKSKLICAQDEEGKLFIYDMKKQEVKNPVNFGKKGDYEGIANVHDTIYVLSSNGKLHQILYFDSPEQHTNILSTPLDKENNTEGLCFDSLNHRLLIACKNKPGNGIKGARAVYAFDLGTMMFIQQPVFTVRLEELKRFLMASEKQKLLADELKNLFDPEDGDATFQPSEIAIHPFTNDVYLISTVGKLLVVLNRDGKIKMIESLSSDIFKQPEGLCFKSDGTLFISDEGKSGHGNILEFKYQGDAK